MHSHPCTRTSFTLTDGRVLSCVIRHYAWRDDDPMLPTYYLGEPHLEPLWWVRGGPQDFGPRIDLDHMPHGLETIAMAMAEPHAYCFHPTVFDPTEPDP
jgi:hypothetical protein